MGEDMQMSCNQQEAFRLLHEGAQALSRAEYAGICVDTEYCEKQKEKLQNKIEALRTKLQKTKFIQLWKSVYKEKTNMNSTTQLGHILFEKKKYEAKKLTEKGRPSVDKEVLEELNIPEVNIILQIRSLLKIRNTYIENILRETVDGVLHSFFNLHTVATYRSSSSNINFQNIPIRIPEVGQIVRRAFLPRPGNRLVEVDYSGIEVCVSACYHKDPTMIEYIHDKSKDMHRDMARELYILEEEEVSKDARYSAKNGFVFPEFYGDYYVDCAQALWKNITMLKLKTAGEGVPLRKHLSANGIKSYRKFEKHVEKVERNFWRKRFPVYTKWKDSSLEEYLKKGYIDTLTGFRCSGPMRKNEVLNYPIQGSAFHCLLWSLIEMDKYIRKNKMKAQIVGQIHDSILFDCPPKEMDHLLRITQKIMCEDIRGAWSWIIVPLEIEAEATPVNTEGSDSSWFAKKEVEINPDGDVPF